MTSVPLNKRSREDAQLGNAKGKNESLNAPALHVPSLLYAWKGGGPCRLFCQARRSMEGRRRACRGQLGGREEGRREGGREGRREGGKQMSWLKHHPTQPGFWHRCSGKAQKGIPTPGCHPTPTRLVGERGSGRAGHLDASSSGRWPGSLAAWAQHPPEDRRANERDNWRTRPLAEWHRGPSHTPSFIGEEGEGR